MFKTALTRGEMTVRDSGIDIDRRKALKKIAVGVGVLAGCAVLPERWVTPLVGNIVLPAHAQTSGSTLGPCTVTMNPGTYNQGTNAINFAVYGSVTPPVAGVPIHLVITTEGHVQTLTGDLVTVAGGTFSIGYLPSDGPGYTAVNVVVTSSVASGTATCSLSVPPAG
jgi:hypothetical protein